MPDTIECTPTNPFPTREDDSITTAAAAREEGGWTCLVGPGNEEDIRYVVGVLESSYDQK